jgi:hypothetical protein
MGQIESRSPIESLTRNVRRRALRHARLSQLSVRALRRRWLLLARELNANDVDFRAEWVEERLREMERISQYLRAIAAEKAASVPFWRTHRFIVLMLALVVSVVFILLLVARDKRTVVALDVRLREISFVVRDELQLELELPVSVVMVQGIERFEFGGSAAALAAIPGISSADFRTSTAGGHIVIGKIDAPPGSRILLAGTPLRLAITVPVGAASDDNAIPAAITWTAAGAETEIKEGGARGDRPISGTGQFAAFAAPGHTLEIELYPEGALRENLLSTFSGLRVGELRLLKEVPRGDGRRVIDSHVVSGTVSYPGLDVEAVELRTAEEVAARLFDGALAGVSLVDRGLRLEWSGAVEGLSAGYGPNRRTLMPTLLESIFANRTRMFATGVIIYLCIFIAALLRGGQISPKEIVKPSSMIGY